jgi:hypothetical protein
MEIIGGSLKKFTRWHMGALHVHGIVVTCYSCAHEVTDCGAWGIVLEGCSSCSRATRAKE